MMCRATYLMLAMAMCVPDGAWATCKAGEGTSSNVFPVSCLEHQKRGVKKDGVYEIFPCGKSSCRVSTFCDMTNLGGGWTLTTRMSSNDQNHYKRVAWNVADMKIVPKAGVQAPRSAKLSDTDINAINGLGQKGTRWVIVAQFGMFYRRTKVAWDSFHGQHHSCSYNRNHYDAHAKPHVTPKWGTYFDNPHRGSCGGGHWGNGWGTLSGIHTNDGTYKGGYTGANSDRVTAPKAYISKSSSNGQWHQPGYVFERAAAAYPLVCEPCPGGSFSDGKGFTCTPCKKGFTSAVGSSECYEVITKKQFDIFIAEQKKALAAVETNSETAITKTEEAITAAAKVTDAKLAKLVQSNDNSFNAVGSKFDAIERNVSDVDGRVDATNNEAAALAQRVAQVELLPDLIRKALREGAKTLVAAGPPVVKSDLLTCNGEEDPATCADHVGQCIDSLAAESIREKCPVMCKTCDLGPAKGPGFVSRNGELHLRLNRGDHVRVENGEDHLPTANEVAAMVQDAVKEAFDNAVSKGIDGQ